MIVFAFVFVMILMGSCPAYAVTVWASPSGGASTASNCLAAQGDVDPAVYVTATQGASCLQSGWTLMHKAGTYTTASPDIFNGYGNTPAGTITAPTKILCEGNQTCIIRPSSSAGGAGMAVRGRAYIEIGGIGHGFYVDMVNVSVSYTKCVMGIRLYETGMTADTPGAKIIGNRVAGHNCFGLSNNSASSFMWVGVEYAWNTVERPRAPISGSNPASPGSASHALYATGRDVYVHHNNLYVYNPDAGDYNYGMHCWSWCRNTTWEYNHVYAEGHSAGFIAGGSHGAENVHMVRYNTFRRVGAGETQNDVCLDTLASGDSVTFHSNTCDGFKVLAEILSGSTGNVVRANVCTARVACTLNEIQDSNDADNVLNASLSLFLDPDNADYSLKSTASSLIDKEGIQATTPLGIPFNGGAADLGAHETFYCNSAVIKADLLDITCSMNPPDTIPVQTLSGVIGWSVSCSGTGCGSPVVADVSSIQGASTLIRVRISGITGGSAASGQTWGVSFSETTGNVRDSSKIGGLYSQHLHSFSLSSIAVDGAGSGGGSDPVYPGTPYIRYKFNGDGTDSSGGPRHATTSGISFVSARYGQGMKTDVGQNDYAEMPYGSGVDPSTQSITFAGGLYIDPSDVGTTRAVIGAPLGGTNQRLYITRQAGTFRIGVQSYSANGASEFSDSSGWHHVCMTLDSATDTATLWVDGVAGNTAGSKQTYTSYTFTGDVRIGLPSGFAVTSGSNHIYDDWVVYQSVADCAALYAAWEPNSSPFIGTIAQVAGRVYRAKESNHTLDALAGVNQSAFVPYTGAFAVALQTDCTGSNCSPIGQRLYYRCALCPSAGAEVPVPSTPTADGVAFYGSTGEFGILSGDHGSLLDGSLTRINGNTLTVASSTPTFDLAQNQSIVNRYILQMHTESINRRFCFYVKEQSGTSLTSVTPAEGQCVTSTNILLVSPF